MAIPGLTAGTQVAPYQPLAIGTQPDGTVTAVFDAMDIAHLGQAKLEGTLIIIGNSFLIGPDPDSAVLVLIESIDRIVGQGTHILRIVGQAGGTPFPVDDFNAFLVFPQPNASILVFQHRPYGVEWVVGTAKLLPTALPEIVAPHAPFAVDPHPSGASGIQGKRRHPFVAYQFLKPLLCPLQLQGLSVQAI